MEENFFSLVPILSRGHIQGEGPGKRAHAPQIMRGIPPPPEFLKRERIKGGKEKKMKDKGEKREKQIQKIKNC